MSSSSGASMSISGRRAEQRGGPRLGVFEDVGQDDRDVVQAALGVGDPDQLLDHLPGVLAADHLFGSQRR
ncbi:MAG: hypothetical protein R2719_04245 [Micropruina sp.]